MLYGFNVNMVSRNLLNIPSLHIAAVALSLNAIPALITLIFTGYFNMSLANFDILKAIGAAVVLGLIGTAIATIIFYVLVKKQEAYLPVRLPTVFPLLQLAGALFMEKTLDGNKYFAW